jgi:shikimate 5-dehydrogenase
MIGGMGLADSRQAVWFLGVSTGASVIHRALPRWGALVGRPLRCRGVDLPLHAGPDDYMGFCDRLVAAPDAVGAVVTTHKAALYRATRARFARLDPLADETGEINAIRSNRSGLRGWARDPVSVGRVTDVIWPGPGGDVICLGGGGTAIALLSHLAQRPARPASITMCETSHRQLRELHRFVKALGSDIPVRVRQGQPGQTWDAEVSNAKARALIVNATGMGKDRPGAPVSDQVRFPEQAVIWELNYRGDLRFRHLAHAQAETYGLSVHDGWSLFCHGWAAALTPILDLPEDPTLGDRFAEAVTDLSPGHG